MLGTVLSAAIKKDEDKPPTSRILETGETESPTMHVCRHLGNADVSGPSMVPGTTGKS